ncbi:hypothetical protein ACLI4U_18950 (plasmid) [Natrialbaceae archaeon A-CW2]
MVRREIEVPEPLDGWVEEAFGDVTTSRAEAYRFALAYAKRKHELEDKRAESE